MRCFELCPTCKGYGTVDEEECSACYGDGYVPSGPAWYRRATVPMNPQSPIQMRTFVRMVKRYGRGRGALPGDLTKGEEKTGLV
jgi:DnaJ-class molecular chaperone